MKMRNYLQKNIFKALIFSLSLTPLTMQAVNNATVTSPSTDTLYFQPNTTPLFSELYEVYNLQSPPAKIAFDEAIYLDQSTPVTILPMQPSNKTVFDKANEVLSAFHKKVGDFELYADPSKPEPFFYTAAGSKQLIVALVYALAQTYPDKKFVFAEKAPFYSGHPNAVTGIFAYPNARFVAFHDPKDIKLEAGEELVEFVTSPNNPDGEFRKPFTDAKIILADFVFASSAFGHDETGYKEQNLAWVKEARNQGKLVFSFNSASKQFGKTGARTGYIWYPLDNPLAKAIFAKFFGYISASTVAGSSIGLSHFLNLILAFNDLPDNGELLRQDAKKTLYKRHELLSQEFLNRYPGSKILSIPGSPTFFAKVQDGRIPEIKASDILLKDLNISVNSGDTMGETTEFIRLNLCGQSDFFKELLNRLAKENKYTKENVFISTK